MNEGLFPILLVEDSRHDALFVQRALKANSIDNPFYVVPHGQACLDFLRNEGEYVGVIAPRPGIILMDIRMPVMSGIECVQQIKNDPHLAKIPIVMLTTSNEERDRTQSYQAGCNTYIQKPSDYNQLVTALNTIHHYWTLAELP